MESTKANDNCSRCNGKGFGDWVVEKGICYACRGTGSKAHAKELRAARKAEQVRQAEIEVVSVLVAAPTRQAAMIAFFEAFVGTDREMWGGSPADIEIAPGWFAITTRLHVASFIEETK